MPNHSAIEINQLKQTPTTVDPSSHTTVGVTFYSTLVITLPSGQRYHGRPHFQDADKSDKAFNSIRLKWLKTVSSMHIFSHVKLSRFEIGIGRLI